MTITRKPELAQIETAGAPNHCGRPRLRVQIACALGRPKAPHQRRKTK